VTSNLTSLPTWILNSAANRSHHVLQSLLTQAGVTGYAYRCLTALAASEHLSQTDLGSAAALDPRDVTHTVRDLEARGLVSRVKDPSHGRRQLVSLTVEGRRTAARLTDIIADVQDTVFRALSTEERTVLLGLLERVARP
jgi:DNA-binding MarR family transcriptional regulator